PVRGIVRPLPEGRNSRLVPGRTAKHGRLAVYQRPARGSPRQAPALRGTRKCRQSGGWLTGHPQARTGGTCRSRFHHPVTALSIHGIMAIEIKVPSLGESITSGILAKWHVKSGDFVRSGQTLFDLETDKITSEGTADADGRIDLKVEEGDEVEIG